MCCDDRGLHHVRFLKRTLFISATVRPDKRALGTFGPRILDPPPPGFSDARYERALAGFTGVLGRSGTGCLEPATTATDHVVDATRWRS